jgi:aspartyl-tRNA(Asn)/glutamyl-tRNA(Gln) amidotransferase subunit A
MAGDWDGEIAVGAPRQMRLGVLKTIVQDNLDAEVASDFERSLAKFKANGILIEDIEFDELKILPRLFKRGGIAGAEAYAFHAEQLAAHGAGYDPRVSGRINLAAQTSAADYINLLKVRGELISSFKKLASGFDAIILPTVANIAPTLADLESEEGYTKLNGLALRNTYLANILNGCAISVPMNRPEKAPTGLMLMAPWGYDRHLFSVAKSIVSLI